MVVLMENYGDQVIIIYVCQGEEIYLPKLPNQPTNLSSYVRTYLPTFMFIFILLKINFSKIFINFIIHFN